MSDFEMGLFSFVLAVIAVVLCCFLYKAWIYIREKLKDLKFVLIDVRYLKKTVDDIIRAIDNSNNDDYLKTLAEGIATFDDRKKKTLEKHKVFITPGNCVKSYDEYINSGTNKDPLEKKGFIKHVYQNNDEPKGYKVEYHYERFLNGWIYKVFFRKVTFGDNHKGIWEVRLVRKLTTPDSEQGWEAWDVNPDRSGVNGTASITKAVNDILEKLNREGEI